MMLRPIFALANHGSVNFNAVSCQARHVIARSAPFCSRRFAEGPIKKNMTELRQRNTTNKESAEKTTAQSPKKETEFTKGVLLQGIIIGTMMFFCLSYVITDSFFWGYKVPTLSSIKKQLPFGIGKSKAIISMEELAKYDGTDPDAPVYISILGHVFDVTSGKDYYAKGSSYGVFAGRDASRAFITGCFKEHLTHDIRGFTSEQIKSLNEWVDFYMKHDTYGFVGMADLPPIDPKSPVPEDCNARKDPKPST